MGMESAIGITVKDFVLLLSDTMCFKSVVNQKNDMDKIVEIGNKKLLIISGNSGDIFNFIDFVQKTVSIIFVENWSFPFYSLNCKFFKARTISIFQKRCTKHKFSYRWV